MVLPGLQDASLQVAAVPDRCQAPSCCGSYELLSRKDLSNNRMEGWRKIPWQGQSPDGWGFLEQKHKGRGWDWAWALPLPCLGTWTSSLAVSLVKREQQRLLFGLAVRIRENVEGSTRGLACSGYSGQALDSSQGFRRCVQVHTRPSGPTPRGLRAAKTWVPSGSLRGLEYVPWSGLLTLEKKDFYWTTYGSCPQPTRTCSSRQISPLRPWGQEQMPLQQNRLGDYPCGTRTPAAGSKAAGRQSHLPTIWWTAVICLIPRRMGQRHGPCLARYPPGGRQIHLHMCNMCHELIKVIKGLQ